MHCCPLLSQSSLQQGSFESPQELHGVIQLAELTWEPEVQQSNELWVRFLSPPASNYFGTQACCTERHKTGVQAFSGATREQGELVG
jgi:hypothetical protein